MTEAEPRTATPGTLLSQWWTLGAIALDARTAGRHITVAWVIIDRYMQSKGGSRASLRYIEKATGLSKPTVIGACRELVHWGYFTRHLGEGTRPSEYGPNWLVVNPSLPLAGGQQGFTTGGQQGLTTTEPSGQQGFTENLLTSPAYRPADGKVGKEDTHAAPTAPPAHGPSASAAETARDPERENFDRFWQVYPRKYQKPKARAAWGKLSPNAELAARIVGAAGKWAAHYATQGTDKKWIPAPANWIAGERYDEDLPEVYIDAREAAIAKKVSSKAARPVTPPAPVSAPAKASPSHQLRLAEIVESEIVATSDGNEFQFTLHFEGGELHRHSIVMEADTQKKQEEGQLQFANLCAAIGVDRPGGTEDLHYRPLMIGFHRDDRSAPCYASILIPQAEAYARLAAEDNRQAEAA